MQFITGFESARFMPPYKTDILATTHHLQFVAHDLRLVRDAGMRMLRYPAPWHRIEKKPGRYDWEWMDRAVEALRENALDPIVDLVHHVSIPTWLRRGFAHPDYPRFQADFAGACAQRYPGITKYTPFNEPFVTTFFAGHERVWYPYGRGPETFVPMMINVARAICRTVHALREVNPQIEIVHIDTCEQHTARAGASPAVQAFVGFCNHRRFICDDLILGKIDEKHPLYNYVCKYGYTDRDAWWFRENRAHIDVRGLDYYPHSEREYFDGGTVAPSPAPSGFAALVEEYRAHFRALAADGVPACWLTETNIRGYSTDRITWLKYMVEQAAQAGLPVFCWFPFIDSTGWGESLLRVPHTRIDPVGIYWLDAARAVRHESELSDLYTRLARGTLDAAGIPAYAFHSPVDAQLQGYRAQMAHWTWRPAD